MRPFEKPDHLTPDQRLAELAGIFATGILRLHARAALPTEAAASSPAVIPAESGAPG